MREREKESKSWTLNTWGCLQIGYHQIHWLIRLIIIFPSHGYNVLSYQFFSMRSNTPGSKGASRDSSKCK